MKNKTLVQLLKLVELNEQSHQRNLTRVELEMKKSARHELGSFMQSKRESLGVSAKDLSDAMGITGCYLRDMEKGNRRYRPEHAVKAISELRQYKLDIS